MPIMWQIMQPAHRSWIAIDSIILDNIIKVADHSLATLDLQLRWTYV